MSETTTERRTAPPPRRPQNYIDPAYRDWATPKQPAPSGWTPAEIAAALTKRERQIMGMLLDAIAPNGGAEMINRATLRTSSAKMQEWFYSGWVYGVGTPDARGSGNTAESSWWWLTPYGEQIAREIKQGKPA